MNDFLVKLFKFIGFLVLVAGSIFMFMVFGWGGVVVSVVVITGAVVIFNKD